MQGAYGKHAQLLKSIGCGYTLIRSISELQQCRALIIPGGESTAMTQIMRRYCMTKPLINFARKNPVFGTCAGLILMAEKADDPRVDVLNLLPFTIARNAYGRQAESFNAALTLSFEQSNLKFPGVFIRAPKIENIHSCIDVLATHKNSPVLISKNNYLAATFHPELTNDSRIHRYWLDQINL